MNNELKTTELNIPKTAPTQNAGSIFNANNIGHITQNVYINNNPNKTYSKLPQNKNAEYYNLIIANNTQLKSDGLFILDSKYVLNDLFTSFDTINQFIRMGMNELNEIYSFPTLLLNPIKIKNADKNTIIGKCQITKIERENNIYIFSYDFFEPIDILMIINNLQALKIESRRLNSELNIPHWAIKNCSLLKIIGGNNE